jgi:uncharacterized protein YndB with AHSA1/START domain
MPRIEASIIIKRPVDRVFAYVADVNSWPQWQPTLLEVKHAIGPRTGVGANFIGMGRVMGRRWPWNLTVNKYELNRNMKGGQT